jgi:PRTRC genetic system protein E
MEESGARRNPSEVAQEGVLMFKELAPYLRQRAVLLTVTHLEDEQIRVNIVPQKLKDGENAALTTPLTLTGTADELDQELPATVVNFVAAHLELKNTLDRAKAEMDAAAKAAQTEARSKSKTQPAKVVAKPEPTRASEAAKPVPPIPSEPPRVAGLFDSPEPGPGPGLNEEKEIPAEHQGEFSDEEDENEAA